MSYEPDLDEVSRAIAQARGCCHRCAAPYRDCCCEDEPVEDFDADDEAPELPSHIAERIQAMRASKKEAA